MTPEVEKKRRELFEAGINIRTRTRNEHGDYVLGEIRDMWAGFNAALDAVEIWLPQPEEFDGYYNGGFAIRPENVVAAITATGLGLKVK